jgi:hypothetical protein
VRRLGGTIHCGTHVSEVHGGERATVVTADGHRVDCGAAVVATNTPVNDRVAIHTKQAPYTTYVIAARVPRGTVEKALYWDTLDAYHYARLKDPQGELLIVGGEDHKTAQSDDAERRFANLELWMRTRWPAAREVLHRWSGQVMEPIDYLAYIGRDPSQENVYIATGDSGQRHDARHHRGPHRSRISSTASRCRGLACTTRAHHREGGAQFRARDGEHGMAVHRLGEAGRHRLGRADPARLRCRAAPRRAQARDLPRRPGRIARDVGALHAPGLHREWNETQGLVGLSPATGRASMRRDRC